MRSPLPLLQLRPRRAFLPKSEDHCIWNRMKFMEFRLYGKFVPNLIADELAWWDVEGVWWPQDPVIKCVSANQCPPLPDPPKGEIEYLEPLY